MPRSLQYYGRGRTGRKLAHLFGGVLLDREGADGRTALHQQLRQLPLHHVGAGGVPALTVALRHELGRHSVQLMEGGRRLLGRQAALICALPQVSGQLLRFLRATNAINGQMLCGKIKTGGTERSWTTLFPSFST